MSDILNPLGGRFIGPPGSVTTTAVLGTVADPPRGLRQVDPGTIIKGIVLGREPDGLTSIATDKGTVRVAANIPLPPGAHVTLEVRPAGDRLQVLILANETAARAQSQSQAQSHALAQTQVQTPGQPQTQPHPQAQSPSQGAGQPQPSAPNGRPAPAGANAPAPADPRSPAPSPSAQPTAPARPDGPSIEFVGSTLRAVVVQAPPSLPAPPAVPPASAGGQGTAGGQVPNSGQAPVQAPVPAQIPGAVAVPTTASPQQPPVVSGAGSTIILPATGQAPDNSTGVPVPGPIAQPLPGSLSSASNIATLQTALIAASLDKRDKGLTSTAPATAALPADEVKGASSPITATAPVPHSPYPADAVEEHSPTSATTPLVPLDSALSAETRQRILALFAAATAGIGIETDEVANATKPAAAGSPLPLGAEIKLRVLAVQLQAHQQIAIDPIAFDPHDAAGQIIFGRVVSMTPAGHAVIHTPIGDLMLQNRSSLPVGAQIALAIDTLETAAPVALPTPAVATPQQALLTLSKGWPTLADFLALIQGGGPDPAHGVADQEAVRQAIAALPHVGAKMAAGLLNAMAALRSGDLGKLLGPIVGKAGSAEREELVRRLKGEFSQLSALAQDRPDVDWRALFLPVIDDQGRVSQINLFYRRAKRNETDPGDKGSGTRFVVEADFTRLGPFQLDGLMRPQRFDLMVRSRLRLSERMRREIETIYEEARGITGFAGAIAFQTVNEFPVIPLDDLKRGQPTYMV